MRLLSSARRRVGQARFANVQIFYFGGRSRNGVDLPQFCSVKVDTVLGQVVSYWQYSFPVLVRTLEASVTWEDAVQIGLDQLV